MISSKRAEGSNVRFEEIKCFIAPTTAFCKGGTASYSLFSKPAIALITRVAPNISLFSSARPKDCDVNIKELSKSEIGKETHQHELTRYGKMPQ